MTAVGCLHDDELHVEMSTDDFVAALNVYAAFMQQLRGGGE